MFLAYWPLTFFQTLSCAICLYATRYTYWQLTTGARLRQFAASNGCQPLRRFKDLDPFFGLDVLWMNLKAMKAHKVMECTKKRIEDAGGNTARFKFLGQSVIVTVEPENIKTILATDFDSYSLGDNRKKMMTPFLGEGIFTTDGAAWHHSRDLLRPNFTRNQITENIVMFEQHMQNVFRAIPRDGSMVDLQDVFFGMSLDIATEFLFGESTGVLKRKGEVNDDLERFVQAFEYSQSALEGDNGEWPILNLFLPSPKLKREHKVVHAFVDSLVEKAILSQSKYEAEMSKDPSSNSKRYIFLHELITRTTNVPAIRSELLNILLAGRDTTASLLSNVWFELSKNPCLWSRVQAEISSAPFNNSSDLPTYEQLKELKYLRAVLNESLRLYPVVPENGRQAERDTVLPSGGGNDGKSPVLVRKGELVAYSLYTMHRREDLFGEDAEVFRPERWIDGEDGEKGLRVGWEYLPFNGGPRICIGQQFALTEAAYVTVRLMQEFEGIESRDPEPWREKLTLTCVGLGGCKVVLTPRERSSPPSI